MSFRWIPSHTYPPHNDFYMWIRYEKNKVKHIEATLEEPLSRGHGRSIIKLPDRTIVICYRPEYRPLDINYDKFLDFSVFGKGPFSELGAGLISAEYGKLLKDDFPSIPEGQILWSDSGGFQLKTNATDFLDPYEIIDYFNYSRTTIGASIDVCPRFPNPTWDSDAYTCCKISKQNNEIFNLYKRKDLKLLNVVHGITSEVQEIWTHEVHTEGLNGWAIGSECFNDYNMYHGLSYCNEQYPNDYYHLFGKGATSNIPFMAWAGKYLPNLSSDSTGARNAGLAKEMQILKSNGLMQRFFVGDLKTHHEQTCTFIPCNCLVCQELKFLDVYSLSSKYKTERPLVWHNMFAIHRQAQFWNELAQKMSLHEYKEYIEEVFDRKRAKDGKKLLDFITLSFEDTEAGKEKYKSKFLENSSKNKTSSSIIESSEIIKESNLDDGPKRSLKCSVPDNNKMYYTSTNTLPKYLNNKKCKENLGYNYKENEDYPHYLNSVKEDKSKVIKKTGSEEEYNRKYIRKRPYYIKNQMRKSQEEDK